MTAVDLKARVREVRDYSLEGVIYRDVSPILADPESLAESIRLLAEWARPRRPDVIVGCEARGFVVGAGMAYRLGCGFVPARRPGKLPLTTVRADYELEYGANSLKLQVDAIGAGARVVIHDDVLAIGGTSTAVARLVERLGGTVVGVTFLVELDFLRGRESLAGYDLHALVNF